MTPTLSEPSHLENWKHANRRERESERKRELTWNVPSSKISDIDLISFNSIVPDGECFWGRDGEVEEETERWRRAKMRSGRGKRGRRNQLSCCRLENNETVQLQPCDNKQSHFYQTRYQNNPPPIITDYKVIWCVFSSGGLTVCRSCTNMFVKTFGFKWVPLLSDTLAV